MARMQQEKAKVKYSKQGYEELQKELAFRKTEKREEIIKAIAAAKSFGDLSENAEYDAARDAQGQNEARIAELESLIENAEIVDESTIDTSIVNIGSIVTVWDKDDKEEIVYTIVGSNETDPMRNMISELSPIGKKLIGKHEFDEVTIEVPMGELHFEIKKIEHVLHH